jgi:hypothetical protein
MLTLDSWWKKALAGMVGACANEVLRMYIVVTGPSAGHIIPAHSSLGEYLIITSLYLALAGVLAILWDDPNPIKCVAIGAGLPRIIQSISQTGIDLPMTPKR